MAWSWFTSKKKESGVAVVGYMLRALAIAMGCFCGCFRIKYYNLASPPESVTSRDKNNPWSLLHCDDESIGDKAEGLHLLPEELDFRELKDEAKFLKACGTLPETPVENRKASKKWEDDISSQDGEESFAKFDLWPHNASTKKLKFEQLYDESLTPIVSEDWVTGAGSLNNTPSCTTDGHNSRRGSMSSIQNNDTQNVTPPIDLCDNEAQSATSTSTVSPVASTQSTQFKNKYVRFYCEPDESAFSSDGSLSGSASQHSKQSRSTGSSTVSLSRLSPYPTPRKLTDDMQTPGTVYPSYMSNMTAGKAARIRSHYVYPVMELIDNNLLQKEVTGKSLNSNDGEILESSPSTDIEIKHAPDGKGINNEASLSPWLKQPSGKQVGTDEQFGSFSGENESDISPTMGGWNGIPNSTSKYKEDQKGSWHATPFDVRLEKPLSGKASVSHRSPIGEVQPFELKPKCN